MVDTNNKPAPDTKFVSGTIWMVALRWCMRAIGLISTIVLARLLTPSDFGIIAMAAAVVGLLDAISATGVDLALIRKTEPSRQLMNAAWTIRILQGLFVALVLLLITPFATQYFDEPLLKSVLPILAIAAFVKGLENIGTMAFRKDLDFAKDFRFMVYQKVAGLVLTVVLALWLRDYRAVVYSLVGQAFFRVGLSFVMHPYRPRLAIRGMGEIWSFSQWLLISRIGVFLSEKIDQFFVGGRVGSASMGNYYIGYEVGTMFVYEIVMPTRRALFPNLSKLLNHTEKFIEASLGMFGLICLVCIPAGMGIFIVAEDLVQLFFGEKWLQAVPVLRWMGLLGSVVGLTMALDLILLVKKQAKKTAARAWLEASLLLVTLILLDNIEIEKVAITRLVVAAALIPIMIILVRNTLGVPLNRLISLLWRPALASGFMLTADRWLLGSGFDNVILNLAAHVLVGVIAYVFAIATLWYLSGRPNGPEQKVLELVPTSLRSKS